MASGSQNMATYLAKQIIGSNAAANPEGALLQSGAGRANDSATGDTWLFLNTVNSTTNPWGIFHSQVDNKIKIIGDGTDDFWVDLDTGDTYILGNLSTGSVLTVRAQDSTHEGGEIVLSPATDSFSTIHIDAYDSMFRLHDGTNERFKVNISSGNTTINGNLGIGADYAVLGGSYKLYVNGTGYFTDIVSFAQGLKTGSRASSGSGSGVEIGIDGGIEIFHTSTPFIDFHYNGDTADYTYRLVANHTDGVTLTSKSGVNCWLYIGNGTNTAGIYWPTFGGGIYMDDSKWLKTSNSKPVLISIGTNNAYGIGGHRLALGLQGGSHVSLMLLVSGSVGYGLAANSNGNWYFGKRTSQSMESTTNDAYIYYGNETLLAPAANNSVDLGDNTHRWKTVQSYGNITAAQGNIWAGTSDNTSERDVGVVSSAGTMYMYAGGTTGGNRGIWLSAHGSGGGKSVFIVDTNNNVTFYGTFSGNASSATYLKDRTNSTASYLNYGASGLAASAITWLCCWNGYEVRAISKAEMRNAVSSPYMVTESYPALMPTNASNNWIKVGTANSSYGLLPSQSGNAGSGHNYLGTSSWYWKYAFIDEIYSVHTRGAVWNDYAEYRKTYEYEPGYAITPSGEYTKLRLESGARIISDTYGFAIGYMENRKDMAPVAISGRVLAYPLHDKSYYEVGDTVCAAEGGKIDKMTREEIKEYPDRIIGIVNEIPDYNIWEPSLIGGASPVYTNGRIWIDVK